jgi:CHASE2 domain-containing sensor protein
VSYVPLLARRKEAAPVVSLALAAFAPTAKAGALFDRQIALAYSDRSETSTVSIAGYERVADAADGCSPLSGSTPARYYLDGFPYQLQRTAEAVIPFEDVLDDGFDRRRVAGKTVLIGSWRPDDADRHLVWGLQGPHRTHGVNIQAAAINTLLFDSFIRPVGPVAQLGWLAALALAAALIRDKVAVGQRALFLLLLIALDVALAAGLSLAGLLSEIPYHLAVIWLSYAYLARSFRSWRGLDSWLKPGIAPAVRTEAG